MAEIKNDTQSETTAKLSDPKLLGAFLNSLPQAITSQKEGRVTAVIAKARYHKATGNQFPQRHKQFEGSCQNNNIIKILLDSESDGDLMFHEKGTSMHFPYAKRLMSTSWHISTGNFLTEGRSTVKFFLIT